MATSKLWFNLSGTVVIMCSGKVQKMSQKRELTFCNGRTSITTYSYCCTTAIYQWYVSVHSVKAVCWVQNHIKPNNKNH